MPTPSTTCQQNNAYARFNKWLAIKVTTGVGSMTCAYIFSVIALVSLPAILSQFQAFHSTFPNWLVKASLIALVSCIAQTYIQLVLLSVIIVGQNIQSTASDARATKTFEDTEIVVDRLDEHTAGGIKTILDRLDQNRGAPSLRLALLVEQRSQTLRQTLEGGPSQRPSSAGPGRGPRRKPWSTLASAQLEMLQVFCCASESSATSTTQAFGRERWSSRSGHSGRVF